MVSKKYLGDYSTEYVLGPGGRVRAEFEYRGKYYRFERQGKALRRARAAAVCIACCEWCVFAAALLPVSAAGRTWYAVLPHVCALLPLVYYSMAAWNLSAEKQPMKRERSDAVSGRMAASALLLLVFSALGAAGFAALLIAGGRELLPGDAVFGVCSAAMLAGAAAAFAMRHAARTVETVPDDGKQS